MNFRKQVLNEREKLNTLHGIKKFQYIWDYYKLPLLVLCIFLYIIAYSLYGHFTHKEPLLYTAFVNVTVSDALTEQLSTEFLSRIEADISKSDFYLYDGLYLSDQESPPQHQYIYASRMKILASIDSEQLDIVLMDKEAFDAFSQSGYLCDLKELLSMESSDFCKSIEPYLVMNTIILEDNYSDLQFDSSVSYQAITEALPFGLDLSQAQLIRNAGFNDTVYLGIIANSPRKATAINYIKYLFE